MRFRRTLSEPLKEYKPSVNPEGGLDVTAKSQFTLKHHVNPGWLGWEIRYVKMVFFFWSQQGKQMRKWTAFDELLQMSAKEAEILSCFLIRDNRSSASNWLNNRDTLLSWRVAQILQDSFSEEFSLQSPRRDKILLNSQRAVSNLSFAWHIWLLGSILKHTPKPWETVCKANWDGFKARNTENQGRSLLKVS